MTGGATNDPEAQGNPMNGVELSARSISRDAIVVDCLTARDQLHCWRLLQNKHSTHLAQCLSPKSSVSGAYLLLLAGAALTKLIVGPAFYSNRVCFVLLSLSLSAVLSSAKLPLSGESSKFWEQLHIVGIHVTLFEYNDIASQSLWNLIYIAPLILLNKVFFKSHFNLFLAD
jgi:hypothetical protein